MGSADSCRNLCQAKFKIWIAQQERKDLALLLGAQDGQERWSGLSVHSLKNTLQFVDNRNCVLA